jgi:hypothetical protein
LVGSLDQIRAITFSTAAAAFLKGLLVSFLWQDKDDLGIACTFAGLLCRVRNKAVLLRTLDTFSSKAYDGWRYKFGERQLEIQMNLNMEDRLAIKVKIGGSTFPLF